MTGDDQQDPGGEWPELARFQAEFREFVAERDWDPFHAPRNLCMALAGEIGELLERFQWLTAEESDALPEEVLEHVAHEIADIQLYPAACPTARAWKSPRGGPEDGPECGEIPGDRARMPRVLLN